MKALSITTGDHDVIGLEVASKALATLGPNKKVRFVLWRSDQASANDFKILDKKFRRIVVKDLKEAREALKTKLKANSLIDIASSLPEAYWVQETAHACLKGELAGLATGPLSKTTIIASGLKDLGHTQILQRVCTEVTGRKPELHMGFLGSKFNVVLATGHCALKDIDRTLNEAALDSALRAAGELRSHLKLAHAEKPIALVGVNPHSGEDGLIGATEQVLHKPFIAKSKSLNVPIEGPLIPDVAFMKENWKNYSVFIANYHDQGLIPFKLVHGFHSGIHITLGLPFIRTSVDHGTAKDLYRMGKADFRSMTLAIKWAIRMVRNKA